jgi:hypothetical protein
VPSPGLDRTEEPTTLPFPSVTPRAWLRPSRDGGENVDTDSRVRWNWRWWFVALSIALLIFWVVVGIVDGWDISRVLGVVAMASLALSFLVQIREVRRKRQQEEPERTIRNAPGNRPKDSP